MELRRLRHLIAVAEHGNFGRAATALYLTQPALSRSIQALEAEVGARLFDRRPSGIELTDIGRLVLRHAIALDAAADDLDREIRLAKGLELGELRIGAGPWGGYALVAPALGRLNALHPRLRARVIVAPWRELPARVRARDVDIVVGALGEIEQLDDFDHLRLSVEDTLVVGRAGHPLSGQSNVTAADMFAYPLAGPGLDSDAAELMEQLVRAVTDDPTASASDLVTVECDNSDVLERLLRESDALTFMPRFLVEADRQARGLEVIGLDLGLRSHFGAAWLRGRSLGGAGAAFLDLLQVAVAERV
jgi:DNA-binding transcriptional LysR family regulator